MIFTLALPRSTAPMSAGLVLATLLALTLLALPASAQDLRMFRIGTGPAGGSLFTVGGVLASALTTPPGARSCDRGGSCGVPGTIAVATTTDGAVSNVRMLGRGQIHAALTQADIAWWAFQGTGPFADVGPVENLRAIATLYPEAVHLVVPAGSPIKSLGDLAGKRVALGAESSGAQADAGLLLAAYGLAPADLKATPSMEPGPAAEALSEGRIDAFVIVDPAPSPAVTVLAESNDIRLVPLLGEPVRQLVQRYPFFVQGAIPINSYRGQTAAVPTVTVAGVFLVGAEVNEELAYQITRALWHDNNRELFAKGHPLVRRVTLRNATKGTGVPLHAGAAAYYFDRGLLD